jgi:beta-galactosidase
MLNDQMIGEKPTTEAEKFKTAFTLPYAPGTLTAIGLQDGQPMAQDLIETASAAAKIRLTPDRAVIHADGQDLSFVTVEVIDAKGHLCCGAAQKVKFHLDGNATLAAVGNADMMSTEPYQGDTRSVFCGRALVIVRASHDAGLIQLRAEAAGLEPAQTEMNSNAVETKPALQ